MPQPVLSIEALQPVVAAVLRMVPVERQVERHEPNGLLPPRDGRIPRHHQAKVAHDPGEVRLPNLQGEVPCAREVPAKVRRLQEAPNCPVMPQMLPKDQ